MLFRYKIITDELQVNSGTLEAMDMDAARRIMNENRWQVVNLEAAGGLSGLLNHKIQGKVKHEAVAAFCSQLAMMVRSGANLVRGLEILEKQMDDRQLKEVIGTIHRSVSRGNSLAQAMRECRGALPELLINLVAVGEESGSLDSILTSMAEYYEREAFVRKKIANAAVYPVILSLVLIALLLFFMFGILPEIMGLFTDTGQALPGITQMVIDAATFMQGNFLYVFGGMIGVIIGLYRFFQIPRFHYYFDAFLLRIPLLGKNIKDVAQARFSRTLALFLHSSIPIVQILNSLESIMSNEVPKRAIVRSKERIIGGETLTSAFGQEKYFDPLVIQMMSIGEETGRLEELMGEVANHYDKRVEVGIARLVALVEPLFTVIIGLIAGVLIIAISLPLFTMSGGVK